MKAGHISSITAHGHGLRVGDVVDIGGASHVVTAVTRDSFAAMRLTLFERVWLAMKSMFRFRGFWARVWSR